MVCDSNVIIDYLNGDAEVINLLRGWKYENQQMFVSPITITEVLGLPKLNTQELRIAQQFLDEFICLPLDAAVAHSAATLCRKYRLKTPDSLIVATTLSRGMQLVSRDRQLSRVKELNILVP